MVLNMPYEFNNYHKAVIDGMEFDYSLNSIPDWIVIKGDETYIGKEIYFI